MYRGGKDTRGYKLAKMMALRNRFLKIVWEEASGEGELIFGNTTITDFGQDPQQIETEIRKENARLHEFGE